MINRAKDCSRDRQCLLYDPGGRYGIDFPQSAFTASVAHMGNVFCISAIPMATTAFWLDARASFGEGWRRMVIIAVVVSWVRGIVAPCQISNNKVRS